MWPLHFLVMFLLLLMMIIKYLILESKTIRDLARALHLKWQDLFLLRLVFKWVEQGDSEMLQALGVKVSGFF